MRDKEQRGKVVAQIRHLKVRQKQIYEGTGKKRRSVGQEIAVYNAKKKVAGDRKFKTVSQATEACEEYQIHKGIKSFKLN